MRPVLALLMVGLISLRPAPAHATETWTTHTLRAVAAEPSPHASIQDMAWLEGRWCDADATRISEENWSAPRNGTMLGMYRHLIDGRPVFYELLTLVEENDSLVLRLKHFHPDLRGWEERDESTQMRLVARIAGDLYFDGLTFSPQATGSLTIYLAVQRLNAAVREEVFRFDRC